MYLVIGLITNVQTVTNTVPQLTIKSNWSGRQVSLGKAKFTQLSQAIVIVGLVRAHRFSFCI